MRKVLPEKKSVRHNQRIMAIDLFCGAGGLTCGLARSGIDVKAGVDSDPNCLYPYERNNKATFILKNIEDVSGVELSAFFRNSSFRLLAGCTPCQTFSKYNPKATNTDKRWWLLRQFSRLIMELKPELVTMENVPGLAEQGVFSEFLRNLQDNDYEVDFRIVKCEEYGIPQIRRRLVLLASKLGKIRLLSPQEFGKKSLSVFDVIGNLPAIQAGQIGNSDDPLHQSAKLSPLNLRRIKASRQGGSWMDWNKKLIAPCHKKKTGHSYTDVYGRMSWDRPAPTITTQFYSFGSGRFGHPEQDRAISLREGALLQGFPKDYEFVAKGAPVMRKAIGRMIGNAVPVTLGEVIGRSFIKHIEEQEGSYGQ